MRVLILGVNGMLGHKLYQRLAKTFDVMGTIRSGFETVDRYGIFDRSTVVENVDALDPDSMRRAIETIKPDCVINAIGVIKQVPASNDVMRTLTINAVFPQRLALFAREYGFRLITISTDCVFSGAKGDYTEYDVPDAADLYGISKLLGEVQADDALTIRTSMIGRELGSAHSIVEWFLANRGGTVNGYTKAIYSGFPTVVLADIISELIPRRSRFTGVWHISSDPITKFDLLTLLNKYYQARVQIEPSDTVVIDRSLNSSRFRATSGFRPSEWEGMIARMAADATPYGPSRVETR